jgi:Flp pilus assembly protein TadD
MEFNDHYKVLERAFEKEGMKGVEDLVRWGVERYEAVVPKGKSIDEYIELARQYHAEGKLVETKEVLHHAMRLDTRNAEIYNQISALEWDIGIRDDAVRTMKQAVALQPRSAVYHTNLGEMLRQLGRAEEAESEFNASLSLNPNDAGVLAMLGLAMAQRGQLTQGLERCRAAAQMAPHDPSTHYMFGLVLAQTGRHAEAQAKYEAALAINPEFAPAREAMQKLLTPASPQSQP